MLSRRLWHTLFSFRFRSVGSIMAANCSTEPGTDSPGKRPQFGNRHLTDPSRVFQHNAWDNVEWSEEQEATALKKVQENSAQLLSPEKQNEYEVDAHGFWNKFYSLHENRFFKDRHWLFTEFPELAPNRSQTLVEKASSERTIHETVKLTPEFSGQSVCSQEVHDTTEQAAVLNNPHSAAQKPDPIVDVTSNDAFRSMTLSDANFPGSSASYRILEVGCGVGNTVFPILKTNNDPGLFVYGCDFSSTAVDLVKSSDDYDSSRCFAFVHDVSDELSSFPVPAESMDIIILIFVLSAILPDKMLGVLQRLSRLLKPGGQILLRDYGRYDMAQLRFKKGRCLSDNFYVRGDGTRVYFFTQGAVSQGDNPGPCGPPFSTFWLCIHIQQREEQGKPHIIAVDYELDRLLTSAGLEKVQNVIDRRLQVNRGKQLTMYRVWIQCKYHKPLPLK